MGRRKKNAGSDDFEIVEVDLDDDSSEDADAFFENDVEEPEQDEEDEEAEEPEVLEDLEELEDLEDPEDLEEYETLEEDEDGFHEYRHTDEPDNIKIQEIDQEEDKETEAEKKLRRHKRRKVAAIVAASVVGVVAAAYMGFAFYFGNHFFFRTTINGTEFSMKSVAQVEEYMKQQVADYSLTIEKSDGTSEKIDGSAIALE